MGPRYLAPGTESGGNSKIPVINILLLLKVDGGTGLTIFSNTKANECLLNGSSKEDLR